MICADRTDPEIVAPVLRQRGRLPDLSLGRHVRPQAQRPDRAGALEGEPGAHRLRPPGGVPRHRAGRLDP